MVLGELGSKITNAIRSMSQTNVVDEAVLETLLKEIGNALLASDVNFKMVVELRKNIKDKVALADLASGIDKKRVIRQAVFDELVRLVDPKKKPFRPIKGRPNVIMLVGLQGAGKTTTVAKLAYSYKKKGFKTAMICADTFRAGAYDQLKQNATKAKVEHHGSYTEADPAKIALEGVERFKAEGYDYIIVDTSGRHKQEEALFKEMEEIQEAVKPDNIIFVMDGSIGQAAFDQAKAFNDRVKIASVIITKLDGHAKGGGALAAIAATSSPIIFIGTGEQIPDLEPFEPKPFVSRLLGMGDIPGMMKMFEEAIPKAKQEELQSRLAEGKFSLRDMQDQLTNIMSMGPIEKVMQMMPGFQSMPQLQGAQGTAKLKTFVNIMDSMTDEELDNGIKLLEKNTSRVVRIARGAGRPVREVMELLEVYKQFEKLFVKLSKMGGPNMNINPRNIDKVASMVPPQLMKQFGGVGGLQNLMKQFNGGKGGFPMRGGKGFPM